MSKERLRSESLQLRNDIATLKAQHTTVVQRLADDRSEVRQLAAERSTLEHIVGLAKEQQQRWTLQLETTRRELEVFQEERNIVVKTTAENRAKFEGLRQVCCQVSPKCSSQALSFLAADWLRCMWTARRCLFKSTDSQARAPGSGRTA